MGVSSVKGAILGLVLFGLGTTMALARGPAIRVDEQGTWEPEEVCIAINPTNPDVLIAGANLDHVFYSHDGGLSWTTEQMSSSLGVAGDPVVIFDAEGTAYYAHLSYRNTWDSWLDRIVVQRSTTDGVSWTNGIGVGYDPPRDHDKQWLIADRTDSPYRGRLHMAWTRFDMYGSGAFSDSSAIIYSFSEDQGATWQPTVRISDQAGDCLDYDETAEGAVPAVGPDGSVYMAWGRDGAIWFDRSLDGGLTWGADIQVATQPGGWDFSIPGVNRCNGFPITVCDISDSPWRGRLYVLFSDQRNGPDDTDIFLCSSDDQGTSWSAPMRVNGDVGTSHQFFPWLAIDPVTGHLYTVYYDRSRTTGVDTDVVLSWSRDGGATFSHKVLSESSFSPQEDVFMGDYIGIDAHDNMVHAIWTRLHEGELSIWTARANFTSSLGDEGGMVISRTQLEGQSANPGGPETRLAYRLFAAAEVRLNVYDLRGHLIRELDAGPRPRGEYKVLWDGRDQTGSAVPSGVYLCHLVAGQEQARMKVTIVR